MQQIHERLPDLVALEKKADEVFRTREAEVMADLEVARTPVRSAGKRAFIALFAIISIVVFARLLGEAITFFAIVLSSILLFVYVKRWYKEYRIYVDVVTRRLAKLLEEVIGLPFVYAPSAEHKDETRAFFNDSGLALESYDSFTVDDMYRCTYEQAVSFREVMTTRQEGSGKNRRTITVFRGLFVTATLPRTLEARTYLSTESEKHKMEHKTFWQKITGDDSAAAETILEWNEFEKDLHVASTDPVEARYILTPNLMADLYDWWQEGKENIRIGFKGNTMSMLLPDHKLAMGTAPFFGGSEALRKHFYTMVRPIWRTLTLIEDIKF
jgi:hypothetical protein